MALTGAFDRHPDLQIIMGHWGETVLFYLDHVQRLQARVKLQRDFMDYFRMKRGVRSFRLCAERSKQSTKS